MTVRCGVCSFSKQAQRPKCGKGRFPGPGEYKHKSDLEPQFNSSKYTSPRIIFPIAPKEQCEKVNCSKSQLPACDSVCHGIQ